MLENVLFLLEVLDNSLWAYAALPSLLVLGFYFSFWTKFVQFRKFPQIFRSFIKLLFHRNHDGKGVHPLKAFFTCISGCTGIGNVVAICTAVQLGGPGALFWIWVCAIAGSIIKYSEVYLGLRYRETNEKGKFQGGPMYFLRKVYKAPIIPKLICVLLCIYGVEIYQFSVVTNTVTANLGISKIMVVLTLLALVIGASSGGVNRVGRICSFFVPCFIVVYVFMGSWVLIQNITEVPKVISLIISSAFTGHASVGAFAGSSILITMTQGIRRGCYSGDVGVGYASVVHSESNEKVPERQASLAIFDIFLDSFLVCTTSVLIVLLTGVWQEPIEASMLVQKGLAQHFPFMDFFMPLFLFLLGYSTVIAYFCTGLKCAEHLSPTWGRLVYYGYAVLSLFMFSFIETYQALIIMSITGGLLLVINLYGIYRLRHEISFDIPASH
jgi:AGCS family alanine or glycine:cation symporter